MTFPTAIVALYWLPLDAGGQSVRFNGRLFEAVMVRREHRPARDLYHSALEVRLGDEFFIVEMTPAAGHRSADRGIVLEGPVGSRLLGRFVLFRYEVRRWDSGVIGGRGGSRLRPAPPQPRVPPRSPPAAARAAGADHDVGARRTPHRRHVEPNSLNACFSPAATTTPAASPHRAAAGRPDGKPGRPPRPAFRAAHRQD